MSPLLQSISRPVISEVGELSVNRRENLKNRKGDRETGQTANPMIALGPIWFVTSEEDVGAVETPLKKGGSHADQPRTDVPFI